MSQNSTLFGVILGAALVGTTLIVRDALEDPETAAAVRAKVKSGYGQIKAKVGEGYAFVREKVQDGYAVTRDKVQEGYAVAREKVQDGYAMAREKASEAGENLRTAAENAPAVQMIKKKVKDIRRAAEPSATYFADSLKAEEEKECRNDAETVVEVEAGIREPEGKEE